jgi:hypothetical protein
LTRTSISSGYAYEDVYGYARAVRVGDMVLVSGTTARGAQLDGDAYTQMMGNRYRNGHAQRRRRRITPRRANRRLYLQYGGRRPRCARA